MNEGVGHALDQALAFWRAPALLANARHRPLPDDVLDVVRIAAGDSNAAEQGAAATGTDPGELTEASAFYLQQLLFAPGTDSYRVLGVNPGTPDARIKEHYRWLVRWLHPDRNPDEWEALYADRVNRAWQDLRTPDKRAAYDAKRDDFGPLAPESATPPVGAPSGANLFTPPPAQHTEPLLSARTTRRLPYLVLGGFGALAGALLALMWYAQGIQPQRVLPSTSAPAPVIAATRPTPPPLDVPPPPVGAPSGATPPLAAPRNNFAPEGAPTEVVAPRPAVEATVAATTSRPPATAPAPRPPTPAPAPPSSARRPVQSTATVAAASNPASTTVANPAPVEAAPPPAPPPITESAAQFLLDQFTTAYARGDLPGLMRLFASDATNNRGGRDAIAYDYQELFDQTRKRQLLLQRQGWLQSGNTATVLASFEARVTPAGGLISRSSHGNIRFDLGWENGSLRIRGVRHDEE